MKKASLLCVALLALSASVASAAGGLNFGWSNCLSDGGTTNKNFACASNSGSNLAVGSYVAPADVPSMSGNEIVVDLQSSSSSMPAWWQFKTAGSCRQTALSVQFANANAVNCIDAWSGQASGGIGAYTISSGGTGNRARVVMAVAIPAPSTLQLTADQEYYSFTLAISNAKTAGSGACAGCSTPVCLVLNSIKLTQPVGVGDFTIGTPATGNYISWQGGAIGGAGCPAAVPTHNTTWGAVKSLYR